MQSRWSDEGAAELSARISAEDKDCSEELALRIYDGAVSPGSSVVISGSAGRMRFPPAGLAGGGPGSLARIEVDGTPIPASSSPEFSFRQGQLVRMLLPGGGGIGDPRQRDREAVEADLANGYITPEAARRDYGNDG